MIDEIDAAVFCHSKSCVEHVMALDKHKLRYIAQCLDIYICHFCTKEELENVTGPQLCPGKSDYTVGLDDHVKEFAAS